MAFEIISDAQHVYMEECVVPAVSENESLHRSKISESIKWTGTLMLIGGLLSLFAAVISLFNSRIYLEVVDSGTITPLLRFGSMVQDLITVPAALVLTVLSVKLLRHRQDSLNVRALMIMTGLASYLFYGYGLYAIQGQYTSLYLVYLAIFSSMLYGVIAGVITLVQHSNAVVPISTPLRRVIMGLLLFILVVLIPVWLLKMQDDLFSRTPGEVYGVFVFDLGIVFPAFAFVIWQLVRNTKLGILLAGVALIKTLTLCLSVAIGELLKPLYGFGQDVGMVIIFSLLTAISGGLSVALFSRLNVQGQIKK